MTRIEQKRLSSAPLGVGEAAQAFIAAYQRGDGDMILSMCSEDAKTDYVPWGDAGRNLIRAAVDVWRRYPAAFTGFSMPIVQLFEDADRRIAVVATLNQGVQASDVDGIANGGRTMSCPHLFVIGVNEDGLIDHVQVWCDQLTLYRQLGFPVGFSAESQP